MTLSGLCPAKLNLFLSVGPPDASGYHPVRTIMQAIDLCDRLAVTPADSDRLEVIGAELPADNTLTKALRLYREVASVPRLHITIDKRIPSEAGLGGGSSDAAGLLRALQLLAPVPVPDRVLFDIAAAIGVDVPFFLVGGTARGEGYGERLTPMDDPSESWYLVAKPEAGCNSKEAYARLDSMPREWRDFPTDHQPYNDFERVAPCESLDLIEWMMNAGADVAGMSGSGSAVFGRFSSELACSGVAKRCPTSCWVARSLTRTESLAGFTKHP